MATSDRRNNATLIPFLVISCIFCIQQTSSAGNTNKLFGLKITRRNDGKYYVTGGENEKKDEVLTVWDIRSIMYTEKCWSLPITEEVIPFLSDDSIICGKVFYPTLICGGQCSSGTHPKAPRGKHMMCTACGPTPTDIKMFNKVVECIRRDNNLLVQKTLELKTVKSCGCHSFKCGKLSKAIRKYLI